MEKRKPTSTITNFFSAITTKKAIILIAIIGFLVFFNALFNKFVWDDNVYIIFNPNIQQFNILKFFGTNILDYLSYYRPIYALYNSLLYALFHNSYFFYHLFQIILHICNTVLLFLLFQRFFKKTLSLFLSLIFLIHPMQVEAVSYIAAVQEILFFFFGVLALLIISEKRVNIKRIAAICGLLFLSLLAKETAILFFFIILVFFILFQQTKTIINFLFGSLITLLFYAVLRFGIAKVYLIKLNSIPISQLNISERLINIPAIIFYYLKTFFYPSRLAVDQLWVVNNITLQSFYIPLILDLFFIALFILLGIYIFRTNRKVFSVFLFFVLWFSAGIFLHLQIFPLDLTVADHWFYSLMAGLLGLIGLFLHNVHLKKETIRIIFIGLSLIILISLSVRTVVRNSNWRNPIILYSHDIQIENNYDLESNLGAELINVGNYNDAIVHINKSIDFFPTEVAFTNLGLAYQKLHMPQEATKYYSTALSINNGTIKQHDHYIYTYMYFAELLMQEGSFSDSAKVLHQAVIDYPTSSRLWLYLAYSEYQLGNSSEALIDASKAYNLDPSPTTGEVYDRIKNQIPVTINFN